MKTIAKNTTKTCGGCDQTIHAQPVAAYKADGQCNGIVSIYCGATSSRGGFILQRDKRHHRCKSSATHGHHCARHCDCKDGGCCD